MAEGKTHTTHTHTHTHSLASSHHTHTHSLSRILTASHTHTHTHSLTSSQRHQVCYLCAGLNHISSTCPCDLCSYCYQTRHKGRSCKSPWAKTNTQCSRCYMTGHHASVSMVCVHKELILNCPILFQICPDQWRQFHNTTVSTIL